MGTTSCIYVRTSDGEEPDVAYALPTECPVIKALDECDPPGATHEITTFWRYWSPSYDAGPWPRIAGVLMALFAAPNVEAVWYYPDYEDKPKQFTRQQLLDFTASYMRIQ